MIENRMFTAVAIVRFLRRPRSGPLILMHTRRGRPAVRRDPLLRDRGGMLSHPAIVSREYGIPGVVGARDATTRIPDGATVAIDGERGTVELVA